MSEFEIYLILKLDQLILLWGLIAGGIFVYVLTYLLWTEGEEIPLRIMFKRWLLPFIFFFVLALMTPTTEQYVIMKVIPKIVNNGQIQKLPKNLLEFVNKWLEENVKDGK